MNRLPFQLYLRYIICKYYDKEARQMNNVLLIGISFIKIYSLSLCALSRELD